MITIITNEPKKVVFQKSDYDEKWFDNHCSDENLLKQCGRENEIIDYVQWEDGEFMASLLYIYFK